MSRKIVGTLLVALAAAAAVHAADKPTRFVGVIASEQPGLMQVAAKGVETRMVRTDRETSYMRWITHKPWQADTRADASALVEGRCVDVKLRSADSDVADILRVSDEPAGSLYDPCKTRR